MNASHDYIPASKNAFLPVLLKAVLLVASLYGLMYFVGWLMVRIYTII